MVYIQWCHRRQTYSVNERHISPYWWTAIFVLREINRNVLVAVFVENNIKDLFALLNHFYDRTRQVQRKREVCEQKMIRDTTSHPFTTKGKRAVTRFNRYIWLLIHIPLTDYGVSIFFPLAAALFPPSKVIYSLPRLSFIVQRISSIAVTFL